MTLKSRLPQIARKLSPTLDEALGKGADGVVDGARLRIDNITGRLARSLEVKRNDREDLIVIEATAVAPEHTPEGRKPYAHWVEFGSGHASPHPFLIPALEAHRGEIKREAIERLRRLGETGE